MSRATVGLLALALTACATDVFGPYKQSISPADIHEIKALIATRPEIHKFILRVIAARPDCVYVETAPTVLDQWATRFVACKRKGKWQIKEGSVEEPKVILGSGPIPVRWYPENLTNR
jgi:hypothetical protein